MVGEAWEALRRSLVHFRGNPVGTIAALDHSSEELNYDQVKFGFVLYTCDIHLSCKSATVIALASFIGFLEGLYSKCLGLFDEWRA